LGNIIPIAPVILVVKAGLLFIMEDLHRSNQYRSHLLGPKNLAKLPPLRRYIDKIPSYVAPVNRKVTKDFIAKIPSYKDGKKSRL
jgi:hypothetical protein